MTKGDFIFTNIGSLLRASGNKTCIVVVINFPNMYNFKIKPLLKFLLIISSYIAYQVSSLMLSLVILIDSISLEAMISWLTKFCFVHFVIRKADDEWAEALE